MLELINGLYLYHGSYCKVCQPDLGMCSRRKDFGRGFYMTTSRDQAISFLNTSIAKAVANGSLEKKQDYGYLSKYELKLKNELAVHIFEEANEEWLHCVAAHRKRKLFVELELKMSKYDIIVGKIADDATNATLTAYLGGAFGTIGSQGADDFCIKQLLPNKLQDQYCFKTDKAIGCLNFVEGEKIWLK